MRSILRNTAVNGLSLFILTQVLPGVKVYGGLSTYIVGGILLALMFKVLKPILSIVSLPINIITLGTFSSLINVIIFYLLTVLISQISITAFLFPGFAFAGFVIPKVAFNSFFAYVVAAFLQSFIVSFLLWLTKR